VGEDLAGEDLLAAQLVPVDLQDHSETLATLQQALLDQEALALFKQQ
jgi:hypothetical protein